MKKILLELTYKIKFTSEEDFASYVAQLNNADPEVHDQILRTQAKIATSNDGVGSTEESITGSEQTSSRKVRIYDLELTQNVQA